MINKLYIVIFVIILCSLKSFAGIYDLEYSPEVFCFSDSQNETDTAFSSDGPVIIYENGRINSYSIRPVDNAFNIYKKSISKSADLYCFVDQIQQGFSFNLKNEIVSEPCVFPLPQKMLVLSDIEGNFEGFKMILNGAGVVDSRLNWSFGNGHLVLVGDIFDRSPNVTECLWLLYKLESEASAQGGKVHVILGNHEFMNLKGDFRYVRQKYFINADSLALPYDKWYAPNTELGIWLRSKNCIEKIGNFIFVHGGISKDFPLAELSLKNINDSCRSRIDLKMTKEEIRKDIFIGRESLIWYRGIAESKLESSALDNILASLSAEKFIIGHTIFDSVTTLYNGKVIAIDLEHNLNTQNGFMNALFFENNTFCVIDNKGFRKPL